MAFYGGQCILLDAIMEKPNNQPECQEGIEPSFVTDRAIEKFMQHQPAVEALMDVLSVAKELDRGMNPDFESKLSRRFVISVPGGDDYYPFAHKKVSLRPRSGSLRHNIDGIEGMIVRYGKTVDRQPNDPKYNGNILLTYGVREGIVAEYLLNATSWEPIASPKDDLLITEHATGDKPIGELCGVKDQSNESIFNAKVFIGLLSDMEPELQDSRDN